MTSVSISSNISFVAFSDGQQCVQFLPDSGKAPNVGETGALPIVYLSSIRPEALPELRWAVQGFTTEPGVTFITGVAKAGKSQLALRMAIALASGRQFLGRFDVPAWRKVLYVLGEDWLPNAVRRIKAHALDMGFTTDEIATQVHPNLQVVPVCGLRLDQPSQVKLLCGALDTFGYNVLVIDPLARFHQLDEDRASGMAPLLRTFREIGDTRVLIVVHHEGKHLEGRLAFGGPLGHRSRGTSAFADLHDNYIALTKTKTGFRIEREHKYEASPEPIDVAVSWTDGTVRWDVAETDTAATLPARVLAYIVQHPGCTTQAVKDGVTGRADGIVRALEQLQAEGKIRVEVLGQAKCWYVCS